MKINREKSISRSLLSNFITLVQTNGAHHMRACRISVKIDYVFLLD